ncbi:hypothetical protein SEA_OTTAWA_27 [Arthrobacter phage Ottawa]|nr:hypothetical protein SEA_KHARCHO_27 [Arthrobacter phage Kharcho]WIC89259.1 hypothetical protein SEA_OTTAWA_27 [Arthrobacter phage Ottawa]
MSNHIEIRQIVATYVDPFPGKAADEMVFLPCGRCGGTGNIGWTNVDGGVCYECRGRKGESVTAAVARKRAKGRVRYANSKERKLIKAQEDHNRRMEEAEARFPLLAGWFEEMNTNSFLMDLWTKAFDYDLSDKQLEAANAVFVRKQERTAARAAEEAELTEVTEGKETITGTIITVKYQDSQYGGSWKMLVKDDRNFKVWGTIPTAIFDQQREQAAEGENPFAEALKGRKVSFNATVSAKEAVTGFGFFKRPTKAQLLPAE